MTKQSTFLTIIIASLLFLIPIRASAGEITLAWDPNSEPDLAGYRLYMQEGEQASGYRFLVDIPLIDIDSEAPSFTIFDLMADTHYYFTIAAYNTSGDESGLSNSVCVINEQTCVATFLASSSSGCFLGTLNPPSAWKSLIRAH